MLPNYTDKIETETALEIIREVAKHFPLSVEEKSQLDKDVLAIEVDGDPYPVSFWEAHMVKSYPANAPQEGKYYVHRYVSSPYGGSFDHQLIGILYPGKNEIEIPEYAYDPHYGKNEVYPIKVKRP